jgi:hypothetical protein
MAEWIAELNEQGLTPEMALLRWGDVSELRSEEQDVLNQLFDEYELLNTQRNSRYSPGLGSGQSNARGTIKLPRESYEYHNKRRTDRGMSWADYIEAQAPEDLETTLRRVVREELDQQPNEAIGTVPQRE